MGWTLPPVRKHGAMGDTADFYTWSSGQGPSEGPILSGFAVFFGPIRGAISAHPADTPATMRLSITRLPTPARRGLAPAHSGRD